ncbi:MAG TPA: hypothetical protein VLI88_07525 [Patescibacteria group bacterium]|jgi:hypothetical protein|nr:hypothetical protein [Patescibacteria group bacterium]
MPGHAGGISCMVSFSINPTDPLSDRASDWAKLERDIRAGLRVSGHKVTDVHVFHMHASGVTLGRNAKALAKGRR